jgi:hypothetical protein
VSGVGWRLGCRRMLINGEVKHGFAVWKIESAGDVFAAVYDDFGGDCERS